MDPLGRECLGIKVWHTLQDEAKIEADIVAVHGLAANPYWTWASVPEEQKWSHWEWLRQVAGGRSPPAPGSGDLGSLQNRPRNEILWLQDLLPAVIPNSRIMTFGYQSNYFKSAPQRDVASCAQELLLALKSCRATEPATSRPIIFIGHCFGGIVIKEALIKATLAFQHFGLIRTSTYGIIFLGTPHRGVSIASYGEMLVSITKASGFGSDTELIHSLREKSSELLKLASNFSDIYDSFDIFCFYELIPWRFSSVIVKQSSAIIEGRLHQGLTVNHSGLNKYRNEKDPNFQHIARVVSEMLACAASRPRIKTPPTYHGKSYENVPGVKVERKAWEYAAQLVRSIELLFDQLLTPKIQLQSNQPLNIQRLIIEKGRFHSWAYGAGLVAISGSRRPLHGLLEGFLGSEVCRCLEDIQEILSPEASKVTLRRDSILETSLQKHLQQLYSFFPDDDRRISDQIFCHSMVETENAADLDSLSSSSLVLAYYDVEATAAMKRIKILCDTSEAQRQENQKLFIPTDELKLDKGKSTGRSTGLHVVTKDDTLESRSILIEWKKYEGYWDTEIGNTLFNRVEMLTLFLRTASKSAEVLDLRILDCLGYCHDEKNMRLGFVFAMPLSTGQQRSYVHLNACFSLTSSPPLLGDRFRLAQKLCTAVFEFHKAQWFHKSFSSYNILLFPDVELANKAAGGTPDISSYTILAPYIIGFNHSRPGKPDEFSEPAHLSLELQRYQHPDYKNRPMQKFQRTYDYYSLGIVLLEIGLWFPLSGLLEQHKQLTMDEFSAEIRRTYCPQLGGFMGSIYRDAVLSLLGGSSGNYADEPGMESSPLMQLVEFQSGILTQLEQCRA